MHSRDHSGRGDAVGHVHRMAQRVPRRRVVYDHVCRPIRAGTPSSFPRQSPSTCPACPLTDTSHCSSIEQGGTYDTWYRGEFLAVCGGKSEFYYLSQCFGFAFWARFTIGRRYPGRAASCWGSCRGCRCVFGLSVMLVLFVDRAKCGTTRGFRGFSSAVPQRARGMIMVRNGDWRDCAVLEVDSVERHERQTIDFSTIPRSCGTPRGNRPNPRAVPQA